MKYTKSNIIIFFIVLFVVTKISAQPNPGYWQQHVDYTIEIDMNVETNQYEGVQKLVYTNNSPDILNRVFYHLYFNAFQPGSEMDARSLGSPDPDSRIDKKISNLKPDEIGYIKVLSLKQNGVDINYQTVGTILEVDLANPIQPGGQATFDMVFNAQVPIQIRRSGRKNSEGVAFSMAQWYPKLAEYDFEGWHADPYIEREFHGVWGDFDVKITIDEDYTIGGTGYLQNPDEIGHGYSTKNIKSQKKGKLTWHFVAPKVHDFTWAADPEYIHDITQVPNGPTLHFFYKSTMPKGKLENWKNLQPKAIELMQFFSDNIGKYPYDQYSIIQGGDGGMEYGMCTLIVGEGTFDGLFGVTAHEMAHSWFQFLLATNELKYYWMDEGFTEYFGELAESTIFNTDFSIPTRKMYNSYIFYARSGVEQPQTTQADRFFFRNSYKISSYYKGYIFLSQLGYIIGQENFNKTIKKYYEDFKFKHPVPNDILRTAEKVSGLDLEWYLTDWTQTTNTIDYAIKSVVEKDGVTAIDLERIGLMPMPLDIQVEYTDGSKQMLYIPLQMMRGEKPSNEPRTILKDWAWAYPTYSFEINRSVREINSITIDPKGLMADINRVNNKW